MIDWDQLLTRPQMVCAVSGEPIAPGSTFYSLLRWQGERFQRIDVSAQAWSDELTEGAVSWWRQQRADSKIEQGPRLLSPEILFGIFRDCAQSSERPRQCLAWLLGWLLVRLRFLKFIDLESSQPDANGQQQPGRLVVQTKADRGKEMLRLRDPLMSANEEQLLQAQVDDLFMQSQEDLGPE